MLWTAEWDEDRRVFHGFAWVEVVLPLARALEQWFLRLKWSGLGVNGKWLSGDKMCKYRLLKSWFWRGVKDEAVARGVGQQRMRKRLLLQERRTELKGWRSSWGEVGETLGASGKIGLRQEEGHFISPILWWKKMLVDLGSIWWFPLSGISCAGEEEKGVLEKRGQGGKSQFQEWCIGPGLGRSRCQDGSKHARILLVESCVRKKWGGSQKRLGKLSDSDAGLTASEGERKGRAGGSVLDCHEI